MRLLFWSIAALSGVGTAAVMPRSVSTREILASEVTGKPGTSSVGKADLPQSGGPELLSLAASMLLGMSIMYAPYALLRNRRG